RFDAVVVHAQLLHEGRGRPPGAHPGQLVDQVLHRLVHALAGFVEDLLLDHAARSPLGPPDARGMAPAIAGRWWWARRVDAGTPVTVPARRRRRAEGDRVPAATGPAGGRARSADDRADRLAAQRPFDVPGRQDVEDDDRQAVVHAERD